MKTAILFFCLLALTFATTSVSFSGNVTNVNGVDLGEFKYRATTVWAIPITFPLLGSFTVAGYASLGLSGSGTNQTGTITGDLIIGAIKFVTNTVPVSFMSYLDASVTASKSINSVSGMDVTSFNYQGSSGYILTSYVRIEERDPSANVVRTVALRDLVWTVATGNSTSGSTTGARLYYITLDASNVIFKNTIQSGESVTFTFLISEALGEVTFGSVTVPVTPKTLESIVEISNWKYVSPSNNLVLVSGVATGSATGSSAGTVTFASGSGDDQVYADFSKHVDVSGTLFSASVKKTSVTDFNLVTDDVSIQATTASVYNGSYNLATVEISFPAGASKITYDPTIGSGTPIVNDNAAGTVFFFCLLLSIVVLLV